MPFQRPNQKKAQPTIEVPSLYGSHASMIEEELSDGTVVLLDEKGKYSTTKDRLATGEVCLRDEKGTYWTTVDRLDTGLADPRRYDSSRVIETPNVKAVVKK